MVVCAEAEAWAEAEVKAEAGAGTDAETGAEAEVLSVCADSAAHATVSCRFLMSACPGA